MAHPNTRWPAGLLALTLLIVAAMSASAKDQDKLKQVIAVTGMDVSFDSFEKSIGLGVEQGTPSRPDRSAFIEASNHAAAIAFAPADLKSKLAEELNGSLTDAALDAVLEFYKQPLAQRLTALENASSKPEALAQMQSMVAELNQKLKADPRRAALYQAMDTSLNLTAGSLENIANLQRAVITGMGAAEGRQLPPDVMDRLLTDSSNKLADQISKLTSTGIAYTYRDVAIEDLETYVTFLASPAGQKLYAAGRMAKNRILVAACLRYGEEVMKTMNKPRL